MSSNQGSAEGNYQEIKVILHAFIEPAHWGKQYENLKVEVRSDLDWGKHSAEVQLDR